MGSASVVSHGKQFRDRIKKKNDKRDGYSYNAGLSMMKCSIPIQGSPFDKVHIRQLSGQWEFQRAEKLRN
jgi:hypothetical protein